MATLYRAKGRKTWQAIIYDPRQKKHIWQSTRTTDRDQAQGIAATFEMAIKGSMSRDLLHAAIDNLIGYDQPTMRVAVIELDEAYKELPDIQLRPTTLKSRIKYLRRFMSWMRDHYPSIEYLDQIERPVVVEFTDEIRDQAASAKTFNNFRSDLQTAFEHLTVRASLRENHFKVIKNLAKTDSKTGRAFTPEEVERILDACQAYDKCPEWYAASMVALYTGLRMASIKELKWSEVLDDRIEHLPPKTLRHNIRVVVPLHPKLQKILAAMDRGKDDDYVFAWVRRRLIGGRTRGDFATILAGADIQGDDRHQVTFHSWRHTWRTRLSQSGVDKDVAQAMGGWTTDVSETVYNQDFERFKKAIEGLE